MTSRSLTVSFSLYLALIALSSACSRPATCALEGCGNDGKVSLASDANADKNADAIPQKQNDLEKQVDGIMKRLSLSEVLGALHAKALELYGQRLTALETKVDSNGADITTMSGKIAVQSELILSNTIELERLHNEFHEELDALALKQKAEIDALKIALADLDVELKNALLGLSEETKAAFLDICSKMEIERAARVTAEENVARVAQENLDTLRTELTARIDALAATDEVHASKLRSLLSKINIVDSKVNGVAIAGLLVAQRTFAEISSLKSAIDRLDGQDAVLLEKMLAKEDALRTELEAAVASLSGVDQGILSRVGTLEDTTSDLSAKLKRLKNKIKNFIAFQTGMNVFLAGRADGLQEGIGQLRSDMLTKIAEAKVEVTAEVSAIITASLVTLTNEVSALQTEIGKINAAMIVLEGSLELSDAEIAAQETLLANLRSEFDAHSTAVLAEISAISQVANSASVCVISASLNLASNNSSSSSNPNYRTITCDGTSIKVLIKD